MRNDYLQQWAITYHKQAISSRDVLVARELKFLEQLVWHRQQLGLSQSDMAAILGTTQLAISRIEHGRGNPSLRLLLKFAQILGDNLHL